MKIITWIKNSFFAEQENWILWIPVFFALGIIFYFSFSSSSYLFPSSILLGFLILTYIFRDNLIHLLTVTAAVFLVGFLWTKFYTEKIVYTPKIKYQFYSTAIGKVDDIKSFYNPILKRNSYQIILKNLSLYKAGSLDGDVIVKKEKLKKVYKKHKTKKHKTKKYKTKKSKSKESKSKEFKPKKAKPKKSKRENKTIIKNYLNVAGYQEIDREFLTINYQSQQADWFENRYINPPRKVKINVNTNFGDTKIGDIIQLRVVLHPFDRPYFPDGYNPAFNDYFSGIGGTGFAASNLKVLKSDSKSNFMQDIKILRQKIAKKILDQTDKNNGAIAAALLVGDVSLINSNIMLMMRNSGLAHLISISGLHFGLAAGIFFFSLRFLLSLNQYLTLHFDIKKIAAFIAILAAFFYLLISGAPIPAIRSFIVITLIFVAILFDLRVNSFRSVAFCGLVILILSPESLFSVSFQLSFAAILFLIVLADLTKQLHINSSDRPFYLKLWFYFLGIVLSSVAATIATTPFSIYHFNNFVTFGVVANLIAIPISSFITMPFGFLALLLMPLGIEKLALIPMQISIDWIIKVAQIVSDLPNAYFIVKSTSVNSFALIVFGMLWIGLWRKSWRLLGLAPIMLGIYLGYKTPLPNLLIDGQRKMVAFSNNDKLIFVKPTKSKKAMIWAKKLGFKKIYNIDDLSKEEKEKLAINCDKNLCQFNLNQQKIMVLMGRNLINKICQTTPDIVINISNKYQLPECLKNSKNVIDNGEERFLY